MEKKEPENSEDMLEQVVGEEIKKRVHVDCDYAECPTRGDFVKCYFEVYKHCTTYLPYRMRRLEGQ